MKKNNFFKKCILTAITFILLSANINAQCDYPTDFQLVQGLYQYETIVTTPAGWKCSDVWITSGRPDVELWHDGFANGTIISPVFTNGCSSISFQYKNTEGASSQLKLEIKQADIVVWDSIIDTTEESLKDVSFDGLAIDGGFLLIITNIGNPNDEWEFTSIQLKDICITANPQQETRCDYTDDIVESGTTTLNWNTTPYTTANGWNWNCCYYVQTEKDVLIVNGSTGTRQGYIQSPVFSNGCSNIKFSYYTQEGVSLILELKQGDDVEWTKTITAIQDKEWHEISEAVSVEGDYQLRITNQSATSGRVGNAYTINIKDICITASTPVIPEHTYQFHVPKDAIVFVGDKDQAVTVAGNYLTKHYVPFTPKDEVFILETDTSRIWYYDLPAPKNSSGGFNYRISREGSVTQVGLFKPKAGTTVEKDTLLVFSDEQLSAYSPKEIDHDVTHLNGRNVADVFMNINAQGYLTLPLQADTVFQLIHTRNWQGIDTDVNNYFIEPDFHYTVLDENGQPSSNVVTVSDSGLIRPVGAGTAIVLVDYDAMLAYHTTNLGLSADSLATYGALFSKLWAENTGVFVVSVAQPEANITTNMNLNAFWAQDGTDKTDGVAIDAEHDVMYFDAAQGSFPYTFKPEGETQVLVATPTVGATITSYSGFATDSVTVNADGSYTVKLGFGRNIVKLISASGATYQVITAKPITYTVSNLTHPDQDFAPGDEVSVLFNTLYHPANKMSGIYNMSAGIQYSNAETNFALILGPGQYTFASRAQEYKVTIPADFTDEDFVLEKGVIKVKGFGSYYGAHRQITIQNGVNPNLNASVREAYFGSIPDIHIPIPSNHTGIANVAAKNISVYPNPFTDYIVVNTDIAGTAAVYNMSGTMILNINLNNGNNRIETSTLPQGIYVLKVGESTVKIVK